MSQSVFTVGARFKDGTTCIWHAADEVDHASARETVIADLAAVGASAPVVVLAVVIGGKL